VRTDLIPIRSEAGSSPSCSCSLKLRWRLFRPGCWDVYAYWSTASTCGHTDICIYVRLYRRPCICMRKWPIRSTDRPTTHRGPLKDRACVVKLFKYITPGPQLQLHKFIHAGIHQRPYLCPNLQLELGPSRAKSFGPNSFSWPALSSTVHCAVLGLWKSVLYAGWGACSRSRQPIDCKWSKWRATADASSPGAVATPTSRSHQPPPTPPLYPDSASPVEPSRL